MPAGFISFPGILNPIRCVATRTVGARPDVAIIWATPQPDTSPDTSGTATLQFSFDATTVSWSNALCDRGTQTVSTTGNHQIFEIQDRRWYWKKCWITRAYNVRQPDGSVDSVTRATVTQIARDIFTAMGESSANLLSIVSTEYPEIILDHDNCVDAIEELLIPRGYIISLNTDNTVTVIPNGTGLPIPVNTDIVSVALTLDPPELPNLLTAVCDKTLVQSKLKCSAVGLDTDGSIKLVANLSYTPAGGWDGTDWETFDFITDPIAKECAKRSVGKWYQAVSQADGSFNLNAGSVNYSPGEIPVTSAWQYLPLAPTLVSANQDIFLKQRFAAAFLEGVVYGTDEDANPGQFMNSAAFTRIDRREWTLDKEKGIVKFRDIAKKKNPGPVDGIDTFADIYLTCSYAVHNNTSFVKDKYQVSLTLTGSGQDIYKLDELQRQIIVTYSANSATVSSISDNATSVTSQANTFLTSLEQKYFTTAGNLVLYRGVYAINTDGINLQIRWDIAQNAVSPYGTWVSQYCEGLPLLPTQNERSIIRHASMIPNPFNVRKAQHHRAIRRLR